MLAVLIMLAPGRQNKISDYWKAKVRIAVLQILDVTTHWNSTLELLERAYPLRAFTHKWLYNQTYSDYWPLFTTKDEWTIATYIVDGLRSFQYWTLWMSKRHIVTLHHVIAVYNDMFDHIDCVKHALARKNTQWKEDLYFAVKSARQKLSKYSAAVTPMTVMLLVAADILDPFWKLQLFRKWDKGMDINAEDETSYTMQYQEAFLKCVENEYCAKHWYVPVIKLETLPSSNLIPSAMASGSCQSCFDQYDLFSDDEEYLTRTNVSEMTPGQSNHPAL